MSAVLSDLEAAKTAARADDAVRAALAARQAPLSAAVAEESDLLLAGAGRLLRRAAALLDASPPAPRAVAGAAAMMLQYLICSSPARIAQAAAFADALLPALVSDCARAGETCSAPCLGALVTGNAPLAAEARRLGALGALVRFLESVPRDSGRGAASQAAYALMAASKLCKQTARTSEELLTFVREPGLLEQVARWLRRDGGAPKARAAAAELLAVIVGRPGDEAAAAACAVLAHPRMLEGIAAAIADADAFQTDELVSLVGAAAGAAQWAGDAQLAAMQGVPGLFDGAAALLLARSEGPPPPASADFAAMVAWHPLFEVPRGVAALLLVLAERPTRRLLAARPRLVAALDARATRLQGWMATADAGAAAAFGALRAPDGRKLNLAAVPARLAEAKASLLQITERDLVEESGSGLAAGAAAAATPHCSAGSGGGGSRAGAPGARSSNSSPAAAPVSAAAAANLEPKGQRVRRCFACGREDGGSAGGGASLLQCAGCKGTGLDAFFCDRACQKAGWKEHKPACEAARRSGSGRGGGGSGSGAGV